MVRVILFGAAAFLLSMGVVTGVLYMTTERPADLHAALAATVGGAGGEATAEDEAGAPGGQGAAPHAPTPAVAAGETDLVDPSDSAPHAGEGAPDFTTRDEGGAVPPMAAAALTVPLAAVTTGSESPLPEPRLGKIFGAMQPREAARVLEQMEDGDIATILGMLNDRQAAAVLANLPPQRAAGISRRGIGTTRTN